MAVQVCWLMFYGLYITFLSRDTHFAANRYYLLAALLGGLLIPLSPSIWSWLYPTLSTDSLLLRTFVVRADQTGKVLQTFDNQALNIINILLFIYLVGFFIRLSLLVTGLSQLVSLQRRSEKISQVDYTLWLTTAKHLPFSFGSGMYWNEAHFQNCAAIEKQAILRHELAHIVQKHSIDIILTEVIATLFWCSPFPWLFRKSLRTVHEYLADEAASAALNRRDYGMVLLRQTPSGRVFEVSNTFIRSQLKKRINMLVQHRSSNLSYLKYIAVFPIVMLLSVSFQVTILAQASLDKFVKTDDVELYKTKKEFQNGYSEDVCVPFSYAIAHTADYTQTDTIITFDPATLKESIVIVNSTTRIKADRMPQFKGGEAAMNAWMTKNMLYPQAAKDAKITGTVLIEFVVSGNGDIWEIKVVGRAHPLLDRAAFALVCEMPKWEPGMQNGENTSVVVTLPIKFE